MFPKIAYAIIPQCREKKIFWLKNLLGRWYFEDRYEKQTQCFYRKKQTCISASLFLHLFSVVSSFRADCHNTFSCDTYCISKSNPLNFVLLFLTFYGLDMLHGLLDIFILKIKMNISNSVPCFLPEWPFSLWFQRSIQMVII